MSFLLCVIEVAIYAYLAEASLIAQLSSCPSYRLWFMIFKAFARYIL